MQGASLTSIGGRAGVSRGLAHHFGSKDALVTQLAERAQTRIGRAMFEAQRRHAERYGKLTALDEILAWTPTSSSWSTPDQTNGPCR